MAFPQHDATDAFHPPPTAPAFLIHNEGDHVGVAVQNVAPGPQTAIYMDSDRAVTVEVREAIPLGHKVALSRLLEGADVIEYGVRVGVMRQTAGAGDLIHTHNIRSARWQTSV